jgi:hypothetical protein
MSDDVSAPIAIGTFCSSSGRVVVCDAAYADLWRADEVTDDAVEVRIIGPDAFEAGLLFDLSSHPLYLYDLSPDMLDDLRASFGELTSEAGFDASLEVLDHRIAHEARIDLHFETGQPTHGIEFDGVWSGAADGLEPGKNYHVFGQPFSDQTEFAGRWRDVWIAVSDAPVDHSELRGYAAVDCGSMLFIDPDAMREWAEGGEAGSSMSYMSAAGAVERDPHEATTIPFGDATACFFANRWGDGLFEIYSDFDADGALVRVRAAVGSERTRKRYLSIMRDGRGASDGPNLALVSRKVLDGAPPRFIYRSEPDHERDSGWRILEGSESDDYIADSENVGIARLRDIVGYHESLEPLMSSPAGAVFERDTEDSPWRAVEDWEPTA